MSDEKLRIVKILILEDKENEAKALKRNLESTPKRYWEAQWVENLTQFKDKIKHESFDVYVIDYDIPVDRGAKRAGGGEKALNALQETIGLAPAIIYSGVLKGEFQEAEVIQSGASYILKKGEKGTALAALIDRIMTELDEKVGFVLKSFFADMLNEKTFYLNLIKEDRVIENNVVKHIVLAEVQRLFDEKPIMFEVHIGKDGHVIHAEQKTT
jgi:DNA-binding response OmpR family regulator